MLLGAAKLRTDSAAGSILTERGNELEWAAVDRLVKAALPALETVIGFKVRDTYGSLIDGDSQSCLHLVPFGTEGGASGDAELLAVAEQWRRHRAAETMGDPRWRPDPEGDMSEEYDDELTRLEEAIISTPATSLRGLAVKAEVAAMLCLPVSGEADWAGAGIDRRAIANVLAHVRQMAGEVEPVERGDYQPGPDAEIFRLMGERHRHKATLPDMPDDETLNRHGERLREIEEALIETPATTMLGLHAKATLTAELVHEGSFSDAVDQNDRAALALVEDIRRMTRGTS